MQKGRFRCHLRLILFVLSVITICCLFISCAGKPGIFYYIRTLPPEVYPSLNEEPSPSAVILEESAAPSDEQYTYSIEIVSPHVTLTDTASPSPYSEPVITAALPTYETTLPTDDISTATPTATATVIPTEIIIPTNIPTAVPTATPAITITQTSVPATPYIHQHVFVPQNSVFKCTGGDVFYLCECGASETRYAAPKTEHKYVLTVVKQATCAENGIAEKKCSICQNVLNETIPKTNKHSYISKVTKNPDCGHSGIKTYTCSVCSAAYTESIPATGNHSYKSSVTVEPTYDSTGTRQYTCTVCGNTYSEKIEKLQRGSVKDSDRRPLDFCFHLSEKNQKLAHKILDTFLEHRDEPFDELTVYVINLDEEYTADDFQDVRYAFAYAWGIEPYGRTNPSFRVVRYNDKPGFLEIYGDKIIYLNQISEYGAVVIYMNYYEEIYQEYLQTEPYVQKILASIQDGDDLYVVNQIADYIQKNYQYIAHNDWIPVMTANGGGSCNAWTSMFRRVCMSCGIKCDVIIGYTDTGGYHAWNTVSIDGKRTFWDIVVERKHPGRMRNKSSIPGYEAKAINKLVGDADALRSYPTLEFSKFY